MKARLARCLNLNEFEAQARRLDALQRESEQEEIALFEHQLGRC